MPKSIFKFMLCVDEFKESTARLAETNEDIHIALGPCFVARDRTKYIRFSSVVIAEYRDCLLGYVGQGWHERIIPQALVLMLCEGDNVVEELGDGDRAHPARDRCEKGTFYVLLFVYFLWLCF